jgi:hypothetical protein
LRDLAARGIAAGAGSAVSNSIVLNGDAGAADDTFYQAEISLESPTKLETLEARVAVLEAALAARPQGITPALRSPGVGHNHGPYLDQNLNVDEASIQHFIALLKVPRATAPVDLEKLREAARVADPSVNEWQEHIDAFVKGGLFGAGKWAGEEVAKQLAHASWVHSVFSALQSVWDILKDILSNGFNG